MGTYEDQAGVRAIMRLSSFLFSGTTLAASALSVLGHDYDFPNKIEGLPAKMSEFGGLEINFFETGDGVKLAYWEAGEGKPLIFIPGWSANGAQYVNVRYLLSDLQSFLDR